MPNLTRGRKHPTRTCFTRAIRRNIIRNIVKHEAEKNGGNRHWRRERFKALWKKGA